MSTFPKMATILAPGQIGVARLSHIDVSPNDAIMASLRDGYTSPGRYVKLYVQGQLMMSDTDCEQRTNFEVVRRAHGDVLIAGLGLGMILIPILKKEDVRSVLVVEKYKDVIQLVGPYFQEDPKLTIIEADALEWKPEKGRKFDTIYFDIWPTICTDNLPEIALLKRRFARYKAPGGWMAAWVETKLRARRRAEQREEKRQEIYASLFRQAIRRAISS